MSQEPEKLKLGKGSAGITLLSLLTTSTVFAADFRNVACEGTYPHHLQGVCTNDRDAIYWCFTTKLVQTDARAGWYWQNPTRSETWS